MPIDPFERYRLDRIWVKENQNELSRVHREHIAVVNKRVVAEGDTFAELIGELERRNINPTAPDVVVETLPRSSYGVAAEAPVGKDKLIAEAIVIVLICAIPLVLLYVAPQFSHLESANPILQEAYQNSTVIHIQYNGTATFDGTTAYLVPMSEGNVLFSNMQAQQGESFVGYIISDMDWYTPVPTQQVPVVLHWPYQYVHVDESES